MTNLQHSFQEEFKTIPGFEDYEISNFGRVKTKTRMLRYTHAVTGNVHFRKSTERFLKYYYNKRTGYKFVQPYKGQRMHNMTVHRLVAITFLPNEHGYKVVNHKDGNKHNNTVSNLEWCTSEYNHEHATRTGLIPRGVNVVGSVLNGKSVIAIKSMIADGVSHVQISKWFQISRSSVSLIHEGKTWRHITGSELVIQAGSGAG